jgi:hypothetical protein
VVLRENGIYTYFAADIAYHLNKFERGFDRVIDVWGADHHGYISRVKGALTAAGADADRLTVALVQFAVLYRNGVRKPRCRPVPASTSRCATCAPKSATMPPLLLRAAQVRPASRFRPRPGQIAKQRQPGVLHPVRPCPHLQRAERLGRQRSAI